MFMKKFSRCLIALSFYFVLNSSIFANRWTPEMMIQYQRLSSTAISEDGKFIAYEISTPILESEKSEFHSQIWLLSTYDESRFQLTQGKTSSSQPKFSPDNKWLGFLSARGEKKTRQLFIISVSGGESIQITDVASSVNRFDWSPDAMKIAFTMADPETDDDKKRKKEKRDWTIVDEDYKYNHLYVVNIEDI